MKFDSIRIYTPDSNWVEFKTFGVTNADFYVLKDVTGLGPPDQDLVMSRSVNQETDLQGGSAQDRELVLRVALQQRFSLNQTATDLREAIYNLITQEQDVPLRIYLQYQGTRVASVKGYVKRIEALQFVREPEVQITISCLGPYFSDVVRTTVPLSGAVTTFSVSYDASASTGFKAKLQLRAPGNYLSVFRTSSQDYIRVNYGFANGDILEINTERTGRGVWLTRGTSRISVLGYVDAVKWLKLFRGSNEFTASASTNPPYWTEFSYVKQYWGV